jgi:putative peptide zinc metalloprotease protein
VISFQPSILPARLPILREELALHPGPRLHDGQPSWTLQDPSRGRFFRLDWLTFEILSRWSLGAPAAIVEQIGAQTPLQPVLEDVAAVLEFVQRGELLRPATGGIAAATMAAREAGARPSWWRWLVHNYLFFRVPLVKPDRWLRALLRPCDFLFRPGFWWLTGLALLLGGFLVTRQWHEFTAAFKGFGSVHGVLSFLVLLVGVKVVHEFGHGIVAAYHGCRVPTMGVAFLVMTPVAYTDTNEAWLLTARRPRLWIGAAGMIAELCLAAWSTLAWALLPDGAWRSIAFVLATIGWIKSLLVNTSPIMRFDGYYLLSDSLDLPNLHTRCFALARWWLRERLFAFGEPPPERFAPPLRRGLIALAIWIWLYRLVVFLGIAIFVYHFFFKALGIILFAVEILWFILMPIYSEIKVWYRQRAAIARSPRARKFGVALLALLLLGLVPLPQRIRLSGEFRPTQEFVIIAPKAAQLRAAPWADGQRVVPDAELVHLESAQAEFRAEHARTRRAALEQEIATASLNPDRQARLPVLQAQLLGLRAELAEAEAVLATLRPRAPFAGVFRAPAHTPAVGEWVVRGEPLGTLVGDGPWGAVAYLPEDSAHLVQEGATALFFPEGAVERPVKMRVVSVERDSSRALAHPLLASIHGGGVPARIIDRELVPEQSVYRLRLEAADTPAELSSQIRRGRVVIYSGREPVLARWGRRALSVVWREFGF